ncbi:MAG: type II/IV secretion system protein [Halieaceae bacterium]|jgi:type IV pilus assembly protein PilB|nr:type II/IV secretion system protein [Halieaceae bacterium]
MAKHWLLSAAANAPGARKIPEDFRLEGDIVTRWGAVSRLTGITPDVIANNAADVLGLPRAQFSTLEIEFAKQIPESVARSQLIVPLVMEGAHALVAAADPSDMSALEEIAFSLGSPVMACLASPDEIETALSDIYGDDSGELGGWGSVSTSLLAIDLMLRRKNGTVIDTGKSATSRLFVELLKRAFSMGASDTHVQPYGDGAIVRNRIDGVLYRALELPGTVHTHLIRHVKAIGDMDPTKSMIPQDGELHMELEHREVDLRLSVIPVSGNERLVVRLLPQDQVRSLSMLKLDPAEKERLSRLSQNADGMILMTGPTGSGKTSLLYAMLAEKNTPDINIMTVEEPVEYRLRGASQIDVDPKTGLTFAKSLRSILRQDPDVVMIGEIRDEETAGIAAQAAMTGHFVLSTVHTLDALLATVRMRDLGVSSATLADALQAVASQRLVRSLCHACRQPLEESELNEDERLFAEIWSRPAWKSIGCDACHSTGFSGRLPVLEVVVIDGELRKALRDGRQDIDQLELLAAETGTRFLAEGFAKRIEDGETTIGEALRVYGRSLFGRLRKFKNLRQAIRS